MTETTGLRDSQPPGVSRRWKVTASNTTIAYRLAIKSEQ